MENDENQFVGCDLPLESWFSATRGFLAEQAELAGKELGVSVFRFSTSDYGLYVYYKNKKRWFATVGFTNFHEGRWPYGPIGLQSS